MQFPAGEEPGGLSEPLPWPCLELSKWPAGCRKPVLGADVLDLRCDNEFLKRSKLPSCWLQLFHKRRRKAPILPKHHDAVTRAPVPPALQWSFHV